MAAWLGQAQAASLYSDKQSAVDASRSARDPFPLTSTSLAERFSLFSPISHSLRSVVPLGSFFGGCPPPPVTSPATRLDFRRATWLPFSGSFPKGATRFYPGAQEKSFDLSLASLSASATGVIVTTNRSVFTLSQSVTTLFACPFAGLKDRNLRDGQSYT